MMIASYPVLCFLCSGCAGTLSLRNQQAALSSPSGDISRAGRTQVSPAEIPAAVSNKRIPLPVWTHPSSRTPRPSRFGGRASASYRENGVISRDTLWQGEILVEGALTIASQATLAIAPGTTIRFRPSVKKEPGLLLVLGRLQAVGKSEAPITFTSDEVNPESGDWQGIVIMDSPRNNQLECCRIEFAENGITGYFSDIVVRQSEVSRSRCGMKSFVSSLSVKRSRMANCLVGADFKEGDAELEDVTLNDNRQGIIIHGGSLFLSGSSITDCLLTAVDASNARLHFENNSINRNGNALIVTSCQGDVVGSNIENNQGSGISLVSSWLKIRASRIIGNSGTGISCRSGGGAVWGSTLERNGDQDLVAMDGADIAAPGNWWGSADPQWVKGRVRGGTDTCVRFLPLLEAPPQFP